MATKKKSSPNRTKAKAIAKRHGKHKVLKRRLLITAGVIVVLLAILRLSFWLSPWPGSLITRYFFTKGGQKMAAIMQAYVPPGVSSVTDQQYAPGGKDTQLDVYYPSNVKSGQILPTIVWIHGGAWVAGSKENVANYLKILAAQGYTTVGINYSIAPEKHYPVPVVQSTEALRYIQANARRFHVNPENLALAGDSAGSQIASQVATIITNPSYSAFTGIKSPMPAGNLKAVVLNCGAYDMTLPNYNGPDGKFLKTVLWAYSGTKHFLSDPRMQQASVVDYVTRDFPPTYITVGNADPLEPQSLEFASKLSKLGVPTDTLFYSADHQPALPHEYQFRLDLPDAQNSLSRAEAFLKARLQ